jgi:hypothetical protein
MMRKCLFRGAAFLLLPIVIGSCSAQPMTLDQELASAGLAGVIGGASGAVFANQARQSYPASILIGAAGMAGIVLLYEEVKREAAQENLPPPPTSSAQSPPDAP